MLSAFVFRIVVECPDTDLKNVGIRSELWVYDGQPHGFFNEQKNQKAFLDTVRKMDKFLQSIDWLEGPVDEEVLHSLLKNQSTERKSSKKSATGSVTR